MQMQTLPFFNTPLTPYYLKPAVKDNPTPLVNTGTLSQNANAPVIQGEVRSGETDAYWRGFKNGGFLALISTFSLAMLYHLNKQTELKQALLRYEAEIRLNERQKVKENNNGLNTRDI